MSGIDLTTTYIGLELANPLVPSASPLSRNLDICRLLEDAGAAAIVMYSLFEEELRQEEELMMRFLIHQEIGHAESSSFLPLHDGYRRGQDQYLEQLAALKAVAPQAELIPVDSSREALDHAADADVIIGYCTRALATRARQVRWIQLGTAGAERCVAALAAAQRTPLVTNMQRVLGPQIAEHVPDEVVGHQNIEVVRTPDEVMRTGVRVNRFCLNVGVLACDFKKNIPEKRVRSKDVAFVHTRNHTRLA